MTPRSKTGEHFTDEKSPLVVFDFDHTLYDGDSGGDLIRWLIRRSGWRTAFAAVASPLLAPMIGWMPTRRRGIAGFLWIGTLGLNKRRELDDLIDVYVEKNAPALRARLLPTALKALHRHLEAKDCVLIATGAPPELARAILAFVAHENVPVIGTTTARKFGAVIARHHCHAEEKVRMIRAAGYRGPITKAYSDSTADLPLLRAAAEPVVVNPKARSVARFARELPAGTPILNWGCADRAGDKVKDKPARKSKSKAGALPRERGVAQARRRSARRKR